MALLYLYQTSLRVELTGLVKILLKVLCRQLAILVGVPTPDVIIGGVTFS